MKIRYNRVVQLLSCIIIKESSEHDLVFHEFGQPGNSCSSVYKKNYPYPIKDILSIGGTQ